MKTQYYRYMALIGYVGLLIWMPLWYFVLTDDSRLSPPLVIAMWVVPLLFPMKGIIQGKPYTHAWANFIVMFYLLHGLTAIYTETDERLYAAIELLFASLMFVGCAFYARMRGKELGLGIKKLKQEMAEEKERFEGK